MYSKNKIIEFPKTNDENLQEAIDLCVKREAGASIRKFEELIDKGCVEAYSYLGAIYEIVSDEVEQDYSKALFYYTRSAEETGAVESYLALARINYFGLGVAVDYRKAFDFYSMIEKETENAIAYLMLGKMYHKGSFVKKDSYKAKNYYLKSIKLDNICALMNLGMLENDQGHKLLSIKLKVKAAYKRIKAILSDKGDIRLRCY